MSQSQSLLSGNLAATVPMSMFGSGQGSDSGMPPLVKSEPEEGLSMAGMYNRRTQAMDLAQNFPAVSAPLYDFHFPSGLPGRLEANMANERHLVTYRCTDRFSVCLFHDPQRGDFLRAAFH